MILKLDCLDLPVDFDGREGIRLGIQKGREVEQVVRASQGHASFVAEIRLVDGDFRGPYVHGPKGERFVYLVWSDSNEMFRRAKVHLSTIPDALANLEEVQGTIVMRDPKGHPLCASVRPPTVAWSALK